MHGLQYSLQPLRHSPRRVDTGFFQILIVLAGKTTYIQCHSILQHGESSERGSACIKGKAASHHFSRHARVKSEVEKRYVPLSSPRNIEPELRVALKDQDSLIYKLRSIGSWVHRFMGRSLILLCLSWEPQIGFEMTCNLDSSKGLTCTWNNWPGATPAGTATETCRPSGVVTKICEPGQWAHSVILLSSMKSAMKIWARHQTETSMQQSRHVPGAHPSGHWTWKRVGCGMATATAGAGTAAATGAATAAAGWTLDQWVDHSRLAWKSNGQPSSSLFSEP